jgi:hypothetical protein
MRGWQLPVTDEADIALRPWLTRWPPSGGNFFAHRDIDGGHGDAPWQKDE